MNKKEMLYKFIKTIERKKLLTKFIINIFDYCNFNDYNYLFRITKQESEIIIDLYDNISNNRFNRYIFDYQDKRKTNIINDGNVFVTHLNMQKIYDSENKLFKLAYLFNLDKSKMIDYANTFLNEEFVDILKNIIKK